MKEFILHALLHQKHPLINCKSQKIEHFMVRPEIFVSLLRTISFSMECVQYISRIVDASLELSCFHDSNSHQLPSPARREQAQ
jgi:hypothetical protein